MDDDWPLTIKAIQTAEPATEGEDLTLGFSMLRALAEQSMLAEIGPGVWRHSGEGVTWMSKLDD